MDDIDTRFNNDDDNDGERPLPIDISIFKHGVTLVGSDRRQYIDDAILNKFVWYVLNNCDEVDEYKEYLLLRVLVLGFRVYGSGFRF